MTQSYTTIKFTIIEDVATITLSRPEAANAMNPVMARELNLAAIECEEHQSLRVVLINAEGKLFCAGGDISEFAAAGKQVGALIREMAGDLHLAISRLTRLKAPVIAAIQGTAAGAGFSLAIAADISIASDTAKFTMAYTNGGLSPDGSSTYFLPQENWRPPGTGADAHESNPHRPRSGGLGRHQPSGAGGDPRPDRSTTTYRPFRQGPTLAYRRGESRLLNDSFNNGLETQMELETRAIADCAMTQGWARGPACVLRKTPSEISSRE